jgi:adenosylhomocysteine nucleosidase
MSGPCDSGKTDLCIVVAVDVEFRIAADLLSERSLSDEPRMKILRGLFGGRRVTILQSGMGAVGFADRLAKHLANNRYDALIVAGLAGGLDPKLRVGDAVLYDLCYDARANDLWRGTGSDSDRALSKTPFPSAPGRYRYRSRYHTAACPEDLAAIAMDEPLSGFLSGALTRSGLPFVKAPGITVGRIVTEAKEKLALGAHYGAAAVDMETYEALSACARFGLPAAALRVISDVAGRDLPDFNRVYNADGRINGWRMLGAMTARPSAAFRLLLTIRHALQSLRENLQAVMRA